MSYLCFFLWVLGDWSKTFESKTSSKNTSSGVETIGLAIDMFSSIASSIPVTIDLSLTIFEDEDSVLFKYDFWDLERILPFVFEVWVGNDFPLLKICSGLETGATSELWGFALVLIFFGARMTLWSRQMINYNLMMFNLFPSSKLDLVVSQGSWASISSPRQRRQFVITPRNSSRLRLEDAW